MGNSTDNRDEKCCIFSKCEILKIFTTFCGVVIFICISLFLVCLIDEKRSLLAYGIVAGVLVIVTICITVFAISIITSHCNAKATKARTTCLKEAYICIFLKGKNVETDQGEN